MQRAIIDRTGDVYGRLTVLEYVGKATSGNTSLWKCRCECGTIVERRLNNLRQGFSQSCGCLKRERTTTHGKTGTHIYNIWQGMIQRCTNATHDQYHNYGGRGITVCDDWKTFENFYRDMGDPPADGLTLERKESDVGYCTENCTWATQVEQQNNRRNNVLLTFEGKTQTISQWARELGINKNTIQTRVVRGWSIERVLSQPWSK